MRSCRRTIFTHSSLILCLAFAGCGGGPGGGSPPPPTGGALTVTVTGIPAGTPASVSVTGPNGYGASVTGTTNLTQLSPGLYTIVGGATLSGNSNYFPSIRSQTSNVSSGATTSVKVDFTIIIPTTTKVLDAAGSQTLMVSPDGSTFTISSSSTIAQALSPGDVLAVGVTSATPEGALRKVLSVTNNGSQIVVTTTQGTLAEAFQQASFGFQGNLAAATLGNIKVLKPGVTARTGLIPKLFSRNRAKHNSLTDPCAGNPVTFIDMVNVPIVQDASGTVTVSGQIEVCPSFQFNWSIGGFPPQLNSLLATATFSSNVHVNLTGRYDNAFNQSVPLATLTGTPITIPIGPLPIVLFPQLTFFVGVSGDVTAGFSTGVTQTNTVTGGISYSNGQVSPVFPTPTANFASDPLGIDAGFSVKGFAGVTVDLLVEGVLSPQFSPDEYLQFDANPALNPWCSLTAGLEGPASVSVTIFGFANLVDFQEPSLFQYSTPVFQCGGVFSSSAASPTLTSVSPNTAAASSPSQPVTLNGSNFVPGSVVSFNGFSIPSIFTSPTTLSATIPQGDLLVPGSFPMTVTNPDTTGADSGPVSFLVSASVASPGTITTVAGDGIPGYTGDGGPAPNAELRNPTAIAFDASGNLFMADRGNSTIRRVDAATGQITTIAGNGSAGFGGDGGPASSAQLNQLTDLAFDHSGNLYFNDASNNRVRKIDTAGVITTVAGTGAPGYSGDGGSALNAQFNFPDGIGLDVAGNLYIADFFNNRIRVVDTGGTTITVAGVSVQPGNIETIAGNGIAGFSGDGAAATAAELNTPSRATLDSSGNLFIADYFNNRVRRVDAITSLIQTVAGSGTPGFSGDGGPAVSADMNGALSVVDAAGNLYVADVYNQRIRVVNMQTTAITVAGVAVQPGDIETIAGNGLAGYTGDGGPAVNASVNLPTGLAIDANARNLYFADSANHVIRSITLK